MLKGLVEWQALSFMWKHHTLYCLTCLYGSDAEYGRRSCRHLVVRAHTVRDHRLHLCAFLAGLLYYALFGLCALHANLTLEYTWLITLVHLLGEAFHKYAKDTITTLKRPWAIDPTLLKNTLCHSWSTSHFRDEIPSCILLCICGDLATWRQISLPASRLEELTLLTIPHHAECCLPPSTEGP